MKKRLNIIFFSICFLTSLIAEAYFMQTGAENLFSVVGIGVVVIVTGYLLMDSVRSKLIERGKEAKLYLDQIYQEETQRGIERYTELANLQKATYVATKKNTAMLSEQFKEILSRLETLENNNTKALYKITELQRKAMEGQKNALNLEINYNKENTKQLIKTLREEGTHSDSNELLNKILESLEKNNELLHTQISSEKTAVYTEPFYGQRDNDYQNGEEELEEIEPDTGWNKDYNSNAEKLTTSSWSSKPEQTIENLTDTGWTIEAEIEVNNLGNGWEADNEQVAEAEQVADNLEVTGWDFVAEGEEVSQVEIEQVSDIKAEPDNVDTTGSNSEVNEELNKLISGWSVDGLTEEKAPDISATVEEEPITEVIDTSIEANANDTPESKVEIKPIYADPNKALTADEIAALFASFGK